jgi:hypothetical protein
MSKRVLKGSLAYLDGAPPSRPKNRMKVGVFAFIEVLASCDPNVPEEQAAKDLLGCLKFEGM